MKRLFHIGLGIAIIVTVALSAWGVWIRSGPRLSATVVAPARVSVGEPFEIRIDLANPNDELAVLDSIDIDDSLLQGFEVVSVAPGPLVSYPWVHQRTWEFAQRVDPGARSTVVFELKATHVGVFSGDVDVCNPRQGFTESTVKIEVSHP